MVRSFPNIHGTSGCDSLDALTDEICRKWNIDDIKGCKLMVAMNQKLSHKDCYQHLSGRFIMAADYRVTARCGKGSHILYNIKIAKENINIVKLDDDDLCNKLADWIESQELIVDKDGYIIDINSNILSDIQSIGLGLLDIIHIESKEVIKLALTKMSWIQEGDAEGMLWMKIEDFIAENEQVTTTQTGKRTGQGVSNVDCYD